MNEPTKNGDETLPIINKLKHPKKKWGNTRNKMKAPMSKKTKEPPKRANHKGNIKFTNPLMSREAYQMEPAKRANHKGNITFPNPLVSREAYQMKGEDLMKRLLHGITPVDGGIPSVGPSIGCHLGEGTLTWEHASPRAS